jgi:glutamyl-tRNA synthetase
MVNFLARIGWAHGDDELFSRAQLIEWFTLEGISPAPSRFNLGKLNWVNQEHMKRMPEEELGRHLAPYLARAGLDASNGPDPGQRGGAPARPRGDARRDGRPGGVFLRNAERRWAEAGGAGDTADPRRARGPAHGIRVARLDPRSARRRDESAAAKHGLKPPQVMMSMRLFVCGTTTTPAIDAVLFLLGRNEVIARMAAVLSVRA